MDTSFKWYNPIGWFSNSSQKDEWKPLKPSVDPTASYNLTYTNAQTISFNGEKTPGGAGPIIDYKLQPYSIRMRSHQAMMESDLAQIGMNKLVTWIIAKGLKIQAEPETYILEEEGITLNKKKFTRSLEARYNLWKKSKAVSFNGEKNLTELQEEAERESMVGGDILVVLRVVDGQIKIQHIDGEHLQSPQYGSEWWPQDLGDGCSIIDGVEINSKREHLAYWVRTYAVNADVKNLNQYNFTRIAAYGKKSGLRMAYLHYGSHHRVNSVRGKSLLASCFEKLNNIDLYSGATLKQAQEAAKLDYQQITELGGVGSPSWAKSVVQGANGQDAGQTNDKLAVTVDGEQVGVMGKVTYMGTVYNNPPGSYIETIENKNPLYFKDFFDTHKDVFFAVLQIPPNVAMGKYDDSYSASRAAIKDWGLILEVKREHHQTGYLDPIVALYLDLNILQNKIQAPGYILAKSQGNAIVIACYRNVRFIGVQVPGIDPMKEVKAIREALGARGKNLPLIDLENGVESLGNGNSDEIIEQFAEELSTAESLGIKDIPIVQQVQKNTTKEKKKPKVED